MKKNYFMLAAATMMFAACAETDLVNEVNVESTPQAIGFETFANKATRAEITNVGDLQGVGFQVWGYKAPTATPMDWDDQYTVFNNVAVSYSSSKWGYADTQYWDRTSTYKFYAAAPSSASSYYSIAPTTGMISITGAESSISTASKDYLIDRDGCTNVDGAYTGTEHADVNFDFHHIMSKVSFKLKAAVPEAIVVTRLVMTGWNSGNGNFVQTLTATPGAANEISEWNIPTAGVGSVTLVGTGSSGTDATITLNADMTTTSKITDEYIIVPQLIAPNTLTFTIDFKIGDEVFSAQVGKLTSQQVWGTDAHTTYTISVGPDVIDFNVTNVYGWDAGTPTPGLEIE